MKERVLVTGASGFIGYHIIEALLTAEYEVVAAVRRLSKVDHLKSFGITFTHLDFDDIEALNREITDKKCNYIIHAAGITSGLTKGDYLKYNTLYTTNLAKAAALAGARFIFLSSLAAIGPLSDSKLQITEGSTPHPVTFYGESKLQAEVELSKVPSLNYIVLRPTAVYGPRERGIFIVFKQLTRGMEFYIGKKEQYLSFIYCKDLATVIVKSLKKGTGSYNLSDGQVYERQQLAKITKDILNLRTLKISLPVWLVKIIALAADNISKINKKSAPLNSDKLNELAAINWACNIDKAKRELDFIPQFELESGLKETLQWYKNENWL